MLWCINDSPRFSKTVRSMLDLRQELQLYLRCSIRDGKTALFWYDYWTELDPLYLLFGNSGPASLRIPLNVTVSQAVRDGNWNLPLRDLNMLRLFKLYYLLCMSRVKQMVVMYTCGETARVVSVLLSPLLLRGRGCAFPTRWFIGTRRFGSKRRFSVAPSLYGLLFLKDFLLEIG